MGSTIESNLCGADDMLVIKWPVSAAGLFDMLRVFRRIHDLNTHEFCSRRTMLCFAVTTVLRSSSISPVALSGRCSTLGGT